MNITVHKKQILSDLTTPVSLYLKVRERYPEILLLESSDYSSKENSMSFLCFDSLGTVELKDGALTQRIGNEVTVKSEFDIAVEMDDFLSQFQFLGSEQSEHNGIFGFSGYESVQYFESIKIENHDDSCPSLRYDFYKYIFVFDHYYEQLYLIENLPEGEESKIDEILKLAGRQNHQTYNFALDGDVTSNMEDAKYLEMIKTAKNHCQRGDVFQIVLSRRFSQRFKGDDFNVYRSLRSINPSPYLFYFDYGGYKIFGSSPEAQVVVDGDHAELHPIAGTFKRTGIAEEDIALGEKLKRDPKENAEHIMLVDLARNDLGKHSTKVEVSKLRELQYFSHVIHLTSKVTGKLKDNVSAFKVFSDSFPAGTLSGAPKYKAMEIIDKLEPTGRGYYGGAIGWIGFDRRLNHAIMIRSFISQGGQLSFQAGAGVVIDSDPESELQEVNNKLGALRKALLKAEEIVAN